MLISLFISLILVLIISFFLDISIDNILVTLIISLIVLVILEKCFKVNKKIKNYILNFNIFFPIQNKRNNFVSLNKNIVETKVDTDINKCDFKGCPINNFIPTTKNQLIPPEMYSQEDCTTDGSCIQKPDENNLFTGFNKTDITKKISNMSFNIAKIENNIKNLNSDEGIFMEHFQNDRTPQELNDIIKPFNDKLIKPYESTQKQEKIKAMKFMETDGVCFHGKVGKCKGGICKSENNYHEPNHTLEMEHSKMSLSAHPYTDEQPSIKITNPGQHDFE